ncbi:MAG: TIGR03905 family TSCPD domain-containing protein [Lachnospiraceae bacterium]|nr:TIGR03905 family TSCPD domain-containing protein [Lachnospiraceae bacterium]
MVYRTKGTCASKIDLNIDKDHTIQSVLFTGGCNGNLQGISKLVVGRRAEEIIDTLEGTRCGFKDTSCPDQLAKALRQAIAQSESV